MQKQYQQAITQYRQRVFSFANYSLRAREDAEDITQDVFIKLWQNWQRIDHSKLNAWLMRVAHNAVVDHVREHKKANEQVDDYAELEDQASEEYSGGDLDDRAFKQQLMEAIKSLDDPFRSILVMRDIQGMSYTDIQQSLDISASQVKVYLHRGRRKLRENKNLRSLYEAMSDSETGESLGEVVSIKQATRVKD
ncbi:MAG: sigma-70 family RNA polymerase sigma factor [Pseudomonadales bacterium]|nr:sigma-70 family RNA polymerase sigma factor [Pseudomonadales bacterium]MBL6817118.1 sigma-70 family RNA polymerase sigma factor [Pseudomonadales bacterium]